MPIYSKNNKNILFIHIPKCGGSSMSHFFLKNKYEESFSARGKALKDIEFWKSSPQEIYMAIDGFVEFNGGAEKEEPMSKDRLNEMMELYPD